MPSMNEIYSAHADRYNELVQAEDYKGNLSRLLDDQVDWKGKRVLEAGVGTGRVTQMYANLISTAVCCDRSSHMLAYAAAALSEYKSSLEFIQADNTDLPQLEPRADIFIEGWSFGHAIVDCQLPAQLPQVVDALLANAAKNLTDAGTTIIIETLGTNTDAPAPPSPKLADFYACLEQADHYQSHVIQTDYQFSSAALAARVLGFFFGDAMAARICEQNRSTIPEWTGVWIKK